MGKKSALIYMSNLVTSNIGKMKGSLTMSQVSTYRYSLYIYAKTEYFLHNFDVKAQKMNSEIGREPYEISMQGSMKQIH